MQPEYLQKRRAAVIEKHATITPFVSESLSLLPCAREVKKAKTAEEKKPLN